VKCGGAAAKEVSISLGVVMQSMSLKKMKTMKIKMIRRRIGNVNNNTSNACAAKKLVTI